MNNYQTDRLAVYDLEVLPNYFLLGAQLWDGSIIQLESLDDNNNQTFHAFKTWLEQNQIQLAGFNSGGYDDPVFGSFLKAGCRGAYETSKAIIEDGAKPWSFYRPLTSIDLMQLLPGRFGLKLAGVRIGHPKLQEFPIDPHQPLDTPERQACIPTLKTYNVNDLEITRGLANLLREEIDLRGVLSRKYGADMRSKGDATMAELILMSELQQTEDVTKKQLNETAVSIVEQHPQVELNYPSWWGRLAATRENYHRFEQLRSIGERLFSTPLALDGGGRLRSSEVQDVVRIGDRAYQMGVGGLHSIDGPGCWLPNEDEKLLDLDVASFYPNLILTQNLTPRAWGGSFQDIYASIVKRRMEAKRSGDSHVAYSLKIAANGVYGKTSDPYSSLYDPQMTAHVTIYGQLSLLVLIAMVEEVAYTCSANTDGITVKVSRDKYPRLLELVRKWEEITRLELEEVEYRGLWQRDVNNYFALTVDGKTKTKGRFVSKIPDLEHNPNANIIPQAVMAHIRGEAPVERYIQESQDLGAFLLVQALGRGWVSFWNSNPMGRFLRFYKSTSPHAAPIERHPPLDAKGNAGKVANSDSCIPVLDMPDAMPEDLDREWYIKEAQDLLDTVARPKVPGMNLWASYLRSLGLAPCFVPIDKPAGRAKVDVDGTDYTGWAAGHMLGVKTGEGILAKVTAAGEVTLYRTTREYPTRTRKSILNSHGFILHYSDRVPLLMDPPLVIQDEPAEGFDEYYTPAELRKVGR